MYLRIKNIEKKSRLGDNSISKNSKYANNIIKSINF